VLRHVASQCCSCVFLSCAVRISVQLPAILCGCFYFLIFLVGESMRSREIRYRDFDGFTRFQLQNKVVFIFPPAAYVYMPLASN
jgi:hypothetical protein